MKRSYETCFQEAATSPTSSPTKRLTVKPQIHPFLLSYPEHAAHLDGLWLFCGSVDGKIAAVNANCQLRMFNAYQVPSYTPFMIYNTGDPDMAVDAICYETFARAFLWFLPQYLQLHFENPKTLRLRSFHVDGSLWIYTHTGDIIIARDEAMVPFLALDKLQYSLQGWAITVESCLHEISSYKDFRLERV